ncbi:MAG: hypothetical protein WC058_13620 [Phycisphaeraceae bacterium]
MSSSDMMMIAGVVLITLVLVVNMRKRFGKRRRRAQADESLTPHEKIERIKQTAGMKDDLRSMMVELEDLTRRFGSQLDSRAIKIEKLLREADQRIKQLEQMTGRSAPPPPEVETSGDSPETDELTRKVTRLSDQGKAPGEIAAALEEHIGKIELILALRQQEKAGRR